MTAWGSVPTTSDEVNRVACSRILTSDTYVTTINDGSSKGDVIFGVTLYSGRQYFERGVVFFECDAGGIDMQTNNNLGIGVGAGTYSAAYLRIAGTTQEEDPASALQSGARGFRITRSVAMAGCFLNWTRMYWMYDVLGNERPFTYNLYAQRNISAGAGLTIKKGTCLMIEQIT